MITCKQRCKFSTRLVNFPQVDLSGLRVAITKKDFVWDNFDFGPATIAPEQDHPAPVAIHRLKFKQPRSEWYDFTVQQGKVFDEHKQCMTGAIMETIPSQVVPAAAVRSGGGGGANSARAVRASVQSPGART